MQTGILRTLTEILFTFFPLPGTLQAHELLAALLNWIASLLHLDIKFIGL